MSYSPPSYSPHTYSPPSYNPPSYSPPSHPHLPSIWTRVLDWVHHLGVADTIEDLLSNVAVAVLEDPRPGVAVEDPPPGVAAEDLRPRAKYVQIVLDAVDDIRFCEKIFDDWMTELDKVMNSSEETDEREQRLGHHLGLLKKHTEFCSNATNEILQCHIQFAFLMAQRIDNVSESHYNSRYDDSETTRLANDISGASRLLSTNITEMTHDLGLFASTLEEVQLVVKKEPSQAERILGWLKYLFKAVDRILATVSPPISPLLPSAEPKIQIPVSNLREGAATFCTEPQEGKESESLDSVILFLKKIVPMEVQNAQKHLGRFDKALNNKRLERNMRAGRRMTLHGLDPAVVAKKWRDVAEQYQSVLRDG